MNQSACAVTLCVKFCDSVDIFAAGVLQRTAAIVVRSRHAHVGSRVLTPDRFVCGECCCAGADSSWLTYLLHPGNRCGLTTQGVFNLPAGTPTWAGMQGTPEQQHPIGCRIPHTYCERAVT